MPDDVAAARPRNFDPRVPCIKDEVSPEEWAARVDLAACYRLIDLYGMSDLTANHISVRVPSEPDHFLINAYGLLYEEMTASSMIKINLDGHVIAKPPFDYKVNRAGFVIHGAIHRARHDVACVIHTHTAAGMAVSALACGLLPISQTAMRFLKAGYHDYEGPAVYLEEQERLAANLGEADLMILRNHGLLTVGATVAQAFNHMHRAELCCRSQLMAMATGAKLATPPDAIVEATYEAFQPNSKRPVGVLDWPALLRKLDRIDPSYRD
jgi:ribulose-5-phosphate 4-epimerase/fuculose-1-phosphate aldolase